MSINVQLPKFEGPLGLLLYLIRKEEMDIMDIKIHEITKQYFEYIKLMKELDLELAGEFVAMAATLIQIKSRMLLPQYNENGEIVEVEDPRKELVQKLLEYQKYQEASKLLYERPLVGRDMWLRGVRETLAPLEEEIQLEDNALFGLISSYRKAMRSMKKRMHKVTAKTQSISARILEMKDRLLVGQKIVMMDLVDAVEDRSRQVLITFLSLLELGKMGFVSIYQSEIYSDIYVEAKKPIEGDIVNRVEEYDSIGSDQVADRLMEKARKEEEAILQDNDLEVSLQTEAQMNFNEDFVLKDEVDAELLAEEKIVVDEIATDEEILAAELEMGSELVEGAEFLETQNVGSRGQGEMENGEV